MPPRLSTRERVVFGSIVGLLGLMTIFYPAGWLLLMPALALLVVGWGLVTLGTRAFRRSAPRSPKPFRFRRGEEPEDED